METLGGITFNPGEANTLTYTFNPAINAVDTVKLKVNEQEIAGTVVSTTSATFAISASVSATFPPYALLDARIDVSDGARVDVVQLQTGGPANTSPVSGGSNAPIRLSAGAGITLSPNPITSTGTITAFGAAGQGVPKGGTAGQILAKDTNTDYDYSWVDETPHNFTVVPEPGASNAITTNFKAWSVAQNALVNLVAETFYLPRNSSSGVAGDVTLKSGGVEAPYALFGYVIRESGALRTLTLDSGANNVGVGVATNVSGAVYLFRGGNNDEADDGYLITLWYIPTV